MAKIMQISPRVYQLSLNMVNAFLIQDKARTLVDTGYENNLNRIFKAIAKTGRDPYKIKCNSYYSIGSTGKNVV